MILAIAGPALAVTNTPNNNFHSPDIGDSGSSWGLGIPRNWNLLDNYFCERVTDMTTSRLMVVNSGACMEEGDSSDYITGTPNEIAVTPDGSGGAVLSFDEPLIVNTPHANLINSTGQEVTIPTAGTYEKFVHFVAGESISAIANAADNSVLSLLNGVYSIDYEIDLSARCGLIVNTVLYVDGVFSAQSERSTTIPLATSYLPTAVNTVVGTVIADGVINTSVIDGSYHEVLEIAGSPAFDIRYTFKVIGNSANRAIHTGLYNGSVPHNVEWQIKNAVDLAWEDAKDGTKDFYNSQIDHDVGLSLLTPLDHYYNSLNQVFVRMYHTSAGNTSHQMKTDRLALFDDSPHVTIKGGAIVSLDAGKAVDLRLTARDDGAVLNVERAILSIKRLSD
jgi:hypothetical protein